MGLFSNQHMDRAVEMFADRFEPDGDNYIYFHGPGHPGKAVSAKERDQLVEAYRKGMTRMVWSIATIALILIFGVIISGASDGDNSIPIWGCIAVVAILSFLTSRHLLQRPLRLLERRPDVRPAKTKADIRHAYYAKMSWREFAAIGVPAILIIGSEAYGAESLVDYYIWGAFTLLLTGALLYGAVLKWRS